MLEVKNLSIRTSGGKMLLDNISFTVRPGICTGITGPSGSGKTTLLKAVLGVSGENVLVNRGEILLDDMDLLHKNAAERRKLCGTKLGFIPQNPITAFNMYFTVGTQMSETFRKRLCLSKKSAKQLSIDTLNSVNLPDTDRIYAAYPKQLSGGMLQRITMAILIGLNPKYIFADEPTSALDEKNKQYFLIERLEQLKKSAAVVFVSHDDDALKQLCDEIIILQNGNLIERGNTNTIFTHPQNEWTREFSMISSEQKEGEWIWNKS